MENNKQRVAIIGAGAIAAVHIDSYKLHKDLCEVVAICDSFVDKAAQLAESKDINNIKVFSDFEEVLQDDAIDIVSICLPPSLHAETTIKALQAKKHVLVEKPMASSLEECDLMITAAKEHNKILSVVCQNRFKTPMMKIKKMLEEKVVGHIRQTTVNSLWWRGENYYDIWWRGRWESESGGCLTSHAVHHIDLMQWFLGMPKKVTAIMNNFGHSNSEVEDIAVAIFENESSLTNFTVSILSHGEEQEMVFQGEKGRISIPFEPRAYKALENGFPEDDKDTESMIEDYYNGLPVLDLEGHDAQIKNFLLAIMGKEPLMITGEEGRKSIEIIMGTYKAAITKQAVEFPLSKDDDFYCKEKMLQKVPHFFEKSKNIDNFATSSISLGRDFNKK